MQQFFYSLISKKKVGLIYSIFRICLHALSYFVALFIFLKNYLYNKGLKKGYRSRLFVVGVGNIVAGGVGKTPLTLLLAKEWSKLYSIGIISRGYKSQYEKKRKPYLISKGNGPLVQANKCGDEPYLIAKNIPESYFWVSKNRKKALKAAEKLSLDIVILDDAMQHRKVVKDLEVAVLDANDLFGQNYYLPRGLLRDSPHSLKRANLIVVNHLHDRLEIPNIKKQLSKYTEAPAVFVKSKLQDPRNLYNGPIDNISPVPLAVFTAIAKPFHFVNALKEEKFEILHLQTKNDHNSFSEKELKIFADEAIQKGCLYLACTEKDVVKLSKDIHLPLEIIWFPMNLEIIDGESHFTKFLTLSFQNNFEKSSGFNQESTAIQEANISGS